jgi:hypothetical protein
MMHATAIVYGIYWDWFDKKKCPLFHHEVALLLRVSLKHTGGNALLSDIFR